MKKAKYTVITKILGIFMLLFSVVGFFVLSGSENISLALWNTVYMVFLPMGGIFNLLDFGNPSYSKVACFSYATALILRVLFDITISGKFHWAFLLMLSVSLLISLLRYTAVVNASKKDSVTQPIRTDIKPMQGDSTIMNTVQGQCRVGIMRQSKVSFSGRVFNIYVDGVKTTSLQNGGTTRLLLAPGRHLLGFAVGPKITGEIVLDMPPGSEATVMCYAKGNGVEAVLTSVDVCSMASSASPASAQPKSGGMGCLIAFGILLLLFALGFFSIKFTVFVFPIK